MFLRREVRERISAAIGALAFLTLFAGLGSIGLWATGSSIYDGWRAQDWVKVKADITFVDVGTASYKYEFQGRKYASDRVGTFSLGGSTDLDDWEDRMDAMLSSAVAEKRPVTAYVNPDNPRQAMLDREIRWRFVLVLMAIAMAFTVGGLFAFVAIGRKALPGRGAYSWSGRGSGAGVPWLKPKAREALTQWGVGLVWNLFAVPIGVLAIPDMWQKGEWFPILLLLLFPFIGLLILWAALRSTVACFREGVFNARSAA